MALSLIEYSKTCKTVILALDIQELFLIKISTLEKMFLLFMLLIMLKMLCKICQF